MRIVIIGGSAAGLVTALLLARKGHLVTVLDRQDLEPAADVETAARTAFRRSAPQRVHSHSYHPPTRRVLQELLPDVDAALSAAGAIESLPTDRMPRTVTDRSPRPGDSGLTTMLARRSTFDWVLGRAAATQPGVHLVGRTRVTGLLARAGHPPRVCGVRTERGELAADVVVDASGRRSAVDRWLAGIGARRTELIRAKCGIAYYTRHFRLRRGSTRPAPGRLAMVAFLRFLTVAAFSTENNTVVVSLCPPAEDGPLRALRRPSVHTAVARMIDPLADWLDNTDPISDVFVMGGLDNTLRRLVADHRPVALGLHAVGDAVCTTNPTFGRGISLAVHSAVDLVSVLAAHPDDAQAQAQAMDAAVTERIAPWYADQASADSTRLTAIRAALRGEPPTPLPDPDEGITPAHLQAAAAVDPDLYRVYSSVVSMVRRPAEVYRDPQVSARVHAVLTAGTAPALPQGPSRSDLLTALTADPRS